MSNLVASPGQSPDINPQGIQTVQVRDLGQVPRGMGSSDDEIDLREVWRALRRRKKLVGVTAAAVIGLAGLVTVYQRVFRPVYAGSFALLITDPISTSNPVSTLNNAIN